MTKNIIKLIRYISVALIGISLVAGCVEQPKPWDFNSLSKITFSFNDTDNDKGEIGGDITLDLPTNLRPKAVTTYMVYWGTAPNAGGKGELLAEVAAADFTSSVLYTVPENSAIVSEYFLLYYKGKEGPEVFSGKASLAFDKFEGVKEPEITDVTQPPPVEDDEPTEQTSDDTPTQADTDTPAVTDNATEPSDSDSTQIIVAIENVLFEFDKSYLKSEFKEQLRTDLANVQDKDQTRLLIAGHADERGSNEYNLALGERRAFAVKRYLISLGFLADNIRIISYGEEKPVETGHNEGAWAKNRRAETDVQ
jgi:peptidoglycan-associated lipoprotein